MVLTTCINDVALESSPYAALLLRAPILEAVGSEAPTRHGPKPRPTEWERMCLRISAEGRQDEIDDNHNVASSNRLVQPGSELKRIDLGEREPSMFDSTFDTWGISFVEEIETPSNVGLDQNDATSRWLAKREENDSKRDAA